MPTRRNFPSYIERRRKSAQARQTESDKLSPAEKLERAVGAKEKAKYLRAARAANVGKSPPPDVQPCVGLESNWPGKK